MQLVTERRVQKFGNSAGITLPAPWLTELGLRAGDEVRLTLLGDRVEVRAIPKTDQANAHSLTELFRGYSGSYRGEETDWGAPVGEEAW